MTASPVEQAPMAARQRALTVVDSGERAARAYGRDDLADRLEAARRRLNDPAVQVLVVGEFKQGKSSLVNALVGADVCPVDDDVATSAPTVIRFGEDHVACVVREAPDDGEPTTEAISFDDLPVYASESGNPRNERRLRTVEIGMPSDVLAGGLELVDTPGVGGLGSAHGAITMAALPMADALIFVTDAGQEMSAPELEFLERARDLCPNVVGVMTKTDFYAEWQRIRDIDLERLAGTGVHMAVLPVSSVVRRLALETGDADLDAESGFPALVAYLRDQVLGAVDDLLARSAANDLLSVVAQLEIGFRSERDALESPERSAEILRELEDTKDRVVQLRGEASRWVTTLNDGIGDLNAEADHDLRSRLRVVLRESEGAIDEDDPYEAWPEFEPWLYRRVAWEVSESYAALVGLTAGLAERVADHFGETLGDLDPVIELQAPALTEESVPVTANVQFDVERAGDKTLAVVRGSYGGFAMFGMVGSLAGLSMLNPLSVPLSLMMGRKALQDEKQRRLTMRRQEAKQALRRYVDEVQFNVAKDLRDTLRRIQRDLRDRFQGRAEELQRTTDEALLAAQRSVQATEEERQERLRYTIAELEKIDLVRRHAVALAPALARSRGAG